LEWAIAIKPGDWIGTCEGCNRQVTEVEPIWVNEGRFRRGKPNKTRVVFEVRFTDNHGRWHYCPGGGCAFPPESVEKIEAYYKAWVADAKKEDLQWDDGTFRARLARMEQAFAEGRPIVDSHGEFLPEFDNRREDET